MSTSRSSRCGADDAQRPPAWDAALTADRPFVLDVHCDPDVPPIPPPTTFEQAKATALAMAMAKGDDDRWGVMKQGLKTNAQEILPGRHD